MPVIQLGSESPFSRFNSPVSQLHEALEGGFVAKRLAQAGISPGAFGLCLRYWEGPLEGVVHREGQFEAVREGADLVCGPDEAAVQVRT